MSRKAEITGLTPTRGLLAWVVVFAHFNIGVLPLFPPDLIAFKRVYLFVDMFFLLSGFLMFFAYGRFFEQKVEIKSFMKFMKSRLARVYPLHLFLILYLLGWMAFFYTQRDIAETPQYFQSIFDNSAILTNLTMTQAWGTHLEGTWNVPAWSISVEWLLYMLFPLLVLLISKFKQWAIWPLLALSMVGLFYVAYVAEPAYASALNELRGDTEMQKLIASYKTPNSLDIITGWALVRGGGSFVIGMLMYIIYAKKWFKKIFEKDFWFPVIWGVIFGSWAFDLLPDPISVLLLGILILHLSYSEGIFIRMLHNRFLNYSGKISYSIYMVHLPLIFTPFIINMALTGELVPLPTEVNYLLNWGLALVFALVVLGISSLTYRYVEMPGNRLVKSIKFGKKSKKRAPSKT